jgi:preprotein translocase subunit SecY
VLARVALVGGLYLALVFLIPEFLLSYANVPVYVSGISLLVAVCVTLDLKAQFQGAALRNLRGERS